MSVDSKVYFCEKCQKTMAAEQFYTSNNLEKYPNDGKLNLCKKCLTMHVDNWNPETYAWILQEIDVPYIPDEWNNLLQRYGKNRSKVTGTTILGRYLSKMKLTQYCDYRWEHNEHIRQMQELKIKQAMKSQGYNIEQIDNVIAQKNNEMIIGEIEKPDFSSMPAEGGEEFSTGYSSMPTEPEIDLGLTEEDITYLRLKWGKLYKQEEWVKLEQLYEDMMNSYDIQSAGHIDTLKLICKTSLKANQLIDIGDIEGYQRVSKVYDGLMRSGNFTAAQNKAESGEYIDSISELVAICETDGFIPRYYTDGPQDKVDRTLQDLQSYTRTLVTEEMGLGNLIEQAVKQIEADKLKEAEQVNDSIDEDEAMENSLFSDKAKDYLVDQDFADFAEFKEELSDKDFEALFGEGDDK